MKSLLICAIVALSTVSAVKPLDLPCVTWIESTYDQPTPNPSDLFSAAYTWIAGFGRTVCENKGYVFPCFTDEPGNYNWGHHDYNSQFFSDYCRNWVNGTVSYGKKFYLPKKGPKSSTWKWHTVSTGDKVPLNAIRYGESVMARSLTKGPGSCFGDGFTGWAVGQANGTFGEVHFSIAKYPYTTTKFEVAVCEAYHPTTTLAPPTPVPTTMVPTTMPPTTASPTLPPNNKPYIRFANTVPSANKITATITQGSTTYTWTDYEFAQFSKWVEIFSSGEGTITLKSGGKTLLSTSIPLTPGPLVVAVKDMWPPVQPTNVETIAASYVPPASGSGVRLFNLSPDTSSASLSSAGKTLVENVIYADGSIWASIPVSSASYTATNFVSGASLATDTFTAPPAPFVFTQFLVGLANTTDSTYKTRMVPLVDAPEF